MVFGKKKKKRKKKKKKKKKKSETKMSALPVSNKSMSVLVLIWIVFNELVYKGCRIWFSELKNKYKK